MGLDGIPEALIYLKNIDLVLLTKLFNHNFWSIKMPDKSRRSILVPIYKNKGDIKNRTNY
jgi:hypothetical protein